MGATKTHDVETDKTFDILLLGCYLIINCTYRDYVTKFVTNLNHRCFHQKY